MGNCATRESPLCFARLKETTAVCFKVPADQGLILYLDHELTCQMKLVPDQDLARIHPHVHIPGTIPDPKELSGGGSGVAVLEGRDEEFGDVVLKHGGHKDLAELFALATIEQELLKRGLDSHATTEAAEMIRRTPDFKFIYLSQAHLWDRSAELWRLLRNSILSDKRDESKSAIFVAYPKLQGLRMSNGHDHSPSSPSSNTRSIRVGNARYRRELLSGGSTEVLKEEDGMLQVYLDVDPVDLLPGKDIPCSRPGQGYGYLRKFTEQLGYLQNLHGWKVTLAQKRIGGTHPTTGMQRLAAGQLEGEMLENLITGLLQVIRHLQVLTRRVETTGVEDVRKEVSAVAGDAESTADAVSGVADSYVGFAIRKNFASEMGRFKRLRDLGTAFGRKKLVLTEEEVEPARMLGILCKRGARMEEVFEGLDVPLGATALDVLDDSWRDVLQRAVSVQGRAALARIWTCGLTDGGLHNVFLGEDGLWLFDLGEPSLMSLPAFLTKLLMSFFHTLGMQSANGAGCGWVNRFLPGKKLRLTAETADLLPKARRAFQEVRGRMVREVFGGEEAVCDLLTKYVALQLLSDAAFCLGRWEQKGGGAKRWRTLCLEKWLWRSLWDFYVAADVVKWGCLRQ